MGTKNIQPKIFACTNSMVLAKKITKSFNERYIFLKKDNIYLNIIHYASYVVLSKRVLRYITKRFKLPLILYMCAMYTGALRVTSHSIYLLYNTLHANNKDVPFLHISHEQSTLSRVPFINVSL